MECLIFDLNDFKLHFPEIAECYSDEQIEAAAKQASVMYRGFVNVLPSQRMYAFYLAVAHIVTIRFNHLRSQGAVKSIKTRDDEITFARSASQDPFDLLATVYGSQLKQMFKLMPSTGFVSSGWVC